MKVKKIGKEKKKRKEREYKDQKFQRFGSRRSGVFAHQETVKGQKPCEEEGNLVKQKAKDFQKGREERQLIAPESRRIGKKGQKDL
ncbi:MAG: hypothetical protein ABDH29_01020 [Aquificaceae bacterium]